jgi:hypothetical protein
MTWTTEFLSSAKSEIDKNSSVFLWKNGALKDKQSFRAKKNRGHLKEAVQLT